MLTSNRFAVSWSYRERDKRVRRSLYHCTLSPCIEAARLISSNPYASDVEVLEVDTGRPITWQSSVIGQVLCDYRRPEDD